MSSTNPNPKANELWDQWSNEIKSRCAVACAEYIRRDATEWTELSNGCFKCCSPLRQDKHPSFQIYPDGGWVDWATGETGDLITYVRLKNGLGFKEALELLAQHFGLPTWEQTKGARPLQFTEEELKKHQEREEESRAVHECLSSIVQLCSLALGSRIREHLQKNYHFSVEFIITEKIGWVPAGLWDLCLEHLPYPPEMLLKTGMFYERRDKSEDRAPTAFRSTPMAQRILFPYWRDGVCAYVIGREFLGGTPKEQINVPDHEKGKYLKLPIHNDKHRHISETISNETFWGEDCVRSKNRGDVLYITEGITDAGILKMIGVSVVSPVTVSFSNRQILRAVSLSRSFKRIVIVNDNEVKKSGEKGAFRMASILHTDGIDVRIATLPRPEDREKIDVNEYIGETLDAHGEAGARAALDDIAKKAVNFPEFLVAQIPLELSHQQMEEELKKIGTSAVRLSGLQREDLWDRVVARFPKLPKKVAKQAFTKAIVEEERRLKRDKTKEEALSPEGEKKRGDEAGSRRQVFDEFGSYESELNDGSRVKVANFSLDLVRVVEQEDGPDLLAVRVTSQDYQTLIEEWVVPAKAWESGRGFKAVLPHVQMVSKMGDDEVSSVHELLSGNGTGHVPHIRGVRTMGWHEFVAPPAGDPLGPRERRQRFVVPAGTMSEDGQWMKTPDVIFQPDGGSNLQTRLSREPENLGATDLHDLARRALPLIFKIAPEDTATVLVSWHAACAFKPWLKGKMRTGFPLMGIQGSPGSGKSSLISRIFWPMFGGVIFGDPMSPGSSVFSLTRDSASANALSIEFDEYQPSELGAAVVWFRRFLKRVYAGETETRGRADQGVNVYALEAPTLISGEVNVVTDDAALVERFLYAELDKSWLSKNSEAKRAFKEISSMQLYRIAPLWWGWTLRSDRDAMLETATALCQEKLAEFGAPTVPERIRANLVTLTFGFVALSAFAQALGVELPTESLGGAIRSQVSSLLDVSSKGDSGQAVGRDGFDDFVADAAAMAYTGKISEGTHYRWIDQEVFLAVRHIEDVRAKWHLELGRRGTERGVNALLKIAREKIELNPETTYVMKVNHQVRMGEQNMRGVMIDPAKIPEKMCVDDFPATTKPSGWGGARTGSGRPRLKPWGGDDSN